MHGRALKDYGDFALLTGGDQLDFFDSVGIIIGIKPDTNNFTTDIIFSIYIDGEYLGYDFTRKQATKEAIKHATEMYNEKAPNL